MGQEFAAEQEQRFVSSDCTWLRRRRCHHLIFQNPTDWHRHFESNCMERDRIVIKLKTPDGILSQPSLQASAARSNAKRSPNSTDTTPEVARLVGERLFSKGRHEMLIRIVRQHATDGEVPELRGFHFGIGAFNVTAGAAGLDDYGDSGRDESSSPSLEIRGTWLDRAALHQWSQDRGFLVLTKQVVMKGQE